MRIMSLRGVTIIAEYLDRRHLKRRRFFNVARSIRHTFQSCT